MTEFDAFADVSWISRLVEFVKSAFEARIPIVGVCFGHQILARAMGGTIARSPDGWEVSVETINLTEAGSALFGKKTLVRKSKSIPIPHVQSNILYPSPCIKCIAMWSLMSRKASRILVIVHAVEFRASGNTNVHSQYRLILSLTALSCRTY